MNKSIVRYATVVWLGTMAWANLGQAVLWDEQKPTSQITVYVYNWAQLEPTTLREAKEVATRIFRNTGVDAVVLDQPLPSENGPIDAAEQPYPHPGFYVHIVPLAMAKRFGLRATIIGLAPGMPEEQDRKTVYVFDHVAAKIAHEQAMARVSKSVSFSVGKGQILGHGMAHEIGHVLLHQASHSQAGLMRASWDRKDLQNMVKGDLLFAL